LGFEKVPQAGTGKNTENWIPGCYSCKVIIWAGPKGLEVNRIQSSIQTIRPKRGIWALCFPSPCCKDLS
jgi:hypothetical protein